MTYAELIAHVEEIVPAGDYVSVSVNHIRMGEDRQVRFLAYLPGAAPIESNTPEGLLTLVGVHVEDKKIRTAEDLIMRLAQVGELQKLPDGGTP